MTVALSAASNTSLAYVCPRCRVDVTCEGEAYACRRCGAAYPIVLGIPDFRVERDPWIDFEDDREKARVLVSRAGNASLDEMVRAYWSMTPSTPQVQANRFIAHVATALDRSREWLRLVGRGSSGGEGVWIDAGTGTGDLATAIAEQGHRVVAIDIALRWLVVARRRAEIAGVHIDLVCCNAEHLPFADATASRVLAVGLLEHCRDELAVLSEARRVIVPGGELRTRTVNRFTVLREPHVGVWGVGYVPRTLADGYVRWRGGTGYRHHRPLSARELRRGLRRAGFSSVVVEPASILPSEQARLGGLAKIAGVYARARTSPVARALMSFAAPLLEARGVA